MTVSHARGLHLGILIVLLSMLIIVAFAGLEVRGLMPPFLKPYLRFLTACPFRTATGAACPLCGTTTAMRWLLCGAFDESRAVNPIAFVVLPVLLSQLPYRVYRCFQPKFSVAEEAGLVLGALVMGLLLWQG